MIKSRLKLYEINENGYLILCGIDINGKEIFYCEEPIVPIKSFYYKCAKTFEMEKIKELYTEKSKGNIILINGNECLIYEYSGCWKKLKSINANLIKRHSKGGQSSVRFSRLAEESRLHYVTHCIDYINILCNPLNSFIYGSIELKSQLLEHFTLKIKLKTENKYHDFNQNTIRDKYFEEIIQSNLKLSNDDTYQKIIDCLNKNPDLLLFSENEIDSNLNEIEFILIIKNELRDKYKNKKIVELDISSKFYAKLKDFIIIGKLFY